MDETKRKEYLEVLKRAKEVGCEVYLDVYNRKSARTGEYRYELLHLKGENVSDPALLTLACHLAPKGRVKLYVAHSQMYGIASRAMTIVLTGLDCIRRQAHPFGKEAA